MGSCTQPTAPGGVRRTRRRRRAGQELVRQAAARREVRSRQVGGRELVRQGGWPRVYPPGAWVTADPGVDDQSRAATTRWRPRPLPVPGVGGRETSLAEGLARTPLACYSPRMANLPPNLAGVAASAVVRQAEQFKRAEAAEKARVQAEKIRRKAELEAAAARKRHPDSSGR